MKVKKEDFGYNLDAIQDPEQKKFMESILGAMADIVNKATEGMLTQKDVDNQFNGINAKLKGYDAEKFDQLSLIVCVVFVFVVCHYSSVAFDP